MRYFLPWLIALPCMVAELFMKWIAFPLTKQLNGDQFQLFFYSPEQQSRSLFSYGVMAALLTAAATIALSFRRHRLLCWLGIALIWLNALSVLQVAWLNPQLLKELSSEWNQTQTMEKFTERALPENLGVDPSDSKTLPLDTVSDRFSAGLDFIHLGGWVSLIAGAAALGWGLYELKSLRLAWIAAAGVIFLTCLSAIGPAWAGWMIARGQTAETKGEFDSAIAFYREAMKLDSWTALSPRLYERIGAIDANFGRTGTVEYGIYHADMASTQVDVSRSVGELAALIPRSQEPLTTVLRKRAADLLLQDAQGKHRRGAYGGAIMEAEKALQFDPRSIVAAYYLSRDYYLAGLYYKAIDIALSTNKRLDDPIARANFSSNLGDAYTKINAYKEAKLAYRDSYLRDYIINLRALSALTGP